MQFRAPHSVLRALLIVARSTSACMAPSRRAISAGVSSDGTGIRS